MSTRSATTRAAFQRVFKDILMLEDGDILLKVLDGNGVKSMQEVLTLGLRDIDEIHYKQGKELISLPVGAKVMLKALKAWNQYLISVHGKKIIDWNDTEIVTPEGFDEFCVSHYDPDFDSRISVGSIPSPMEATSMPPKPKIVTPMKPSSVQEFRRGTKRDKAHYEKLRDEKQWDSWRRSTVATIYAHGCENILSPTYSPETPEDAMLFTEQNNFMYDVFISTMLTSMGQFFVRSYENTRDAQAVWRDYSNFMRTSTRADIEIEDLMTALTSKRLTANYRGTSQSFVLQWLDNIRRYESMTPTSAHFPDILKKAMLQNALVGIKIFNDVKISEQIEIAKGRSAIPYNEYVGLVQKVAANHDNYLKIANPPKRRDVNVHHLGYGDYYDDEFYQDPEEFPGGDDSDNIGSISVSAAARTHPIRRRPALPKQVWQKLSKEDQNAWDQLSDRGKLSIMFAYKDRETTDVKGKQQVKLADTVDHQDDDNFVDASASLPGEVEQDAVEEATVLVNAAARKTPLPPSDIRRVLSSNKKKANLKVDTNLHLFSPIPNLVYQVSANRRSTSESLVDRGANGGIAGSNTRLIAKTDRQVDVSGIDNHQMTNLDIVTAGGVVPSQRGDVIVILHQYAYVPHGQTIHACVQLEAFGNAVDDRSVKLNSGSQTITTLDGYVLPLDFSRGLTYLPIRPFTDAEWESLPHVVLTSDVEWDPSIADHKLTGDEEWHDAVSDLPAPGPPTVFDAQGQLRRVAAFSDLHTSTFGTASCLSSHATATVPSRRSYERYRNYFLNASVDTIRRTFEATTQFARSGWITGHIYDTHRAPFPALNVVRRNEPVATDTIYSDTPAIDDGSTYAQYFCGTQTHFCDVFGMKSDAQFVNTLFDVIRKRGAMDVLVSDRAESLISTKVKDVLRHLCISDQQSEPHFHHQNPAERHYRFVKHNMQRILDQSGAPASLWLLCFKYVCFIMNRTALRSLDWRTPFERLTGSTPDISMIYRFKFWDHVFIKSDDSRGGIHFPSAPAELSARFVGFSESVGHPMTYIVLREDTQKIVYRSRVRLATIQPNARALQAIAPAVGGDANEEDGDGNPNPESVEGDDNIPIDHEQHALPAPPDPPPTYTDSTIPNIELDDLIGRTYLTVPEEDGTRERLRIVEVLTARDRDLANQEAVVKFRATNEDGTYDEIISYNQLMEKIEGEDGDSDEWHFTSIDDHQGPLLPSDPDYKGSRWNVRVNWDNGEISYEPLSIIAKSDPVTCAIYARENGLLELEGWKRFRRLARRQKKLVRLANQSKLQAFRNRPVFKFGVQVPRNHLEAVRLDEANGNTKWQDAEKTELGQILAYEVFTDKGKGFIPTGHKRIRVHMIYDVKHDLRRKARLVADGHLTETPLESIYSSVVSLRGLRITIFLAELNQLELWCTDIGNAYLEAYTDEKLYVIAGGEFSHLEGHTLIINKALYGLKTSGKRWWERFSEILTDMGFVASRAEPDIWMRRVSDHYEYIARYVDDLAIASRNPKAVIAEFQVTHKLKLKGTGPIEYHLGCNFFRDKDGVLCMAPKKYIDRMMDSYFRMFGAKPKQTYSSPLEKGDHPELDTSDELDADGIKKFQSMVGAAQWAISLGRFDISTAVMTMSKFRAAPRNGHLERMKRVYGYLAKMCHGTIRYRTELPDYSDLAVPTYDWAKSIYGDVHEVVPDDCPIPLGKPVIMTTYVDANLCHDMTTGRAVTGILHLLNQTVIDAFSKRQPTVETATYGSEFMAARVATEQIIELRTTLRYLGVVLEGPTYMFGDNQTVVNSSTLPSSRLHKRHVLLSYHRVREAIAAGVLHFIHVPGNSNPADIQSKAWGYQQVWPMLKAILFWEGDTHDIE